MVFRFRLLEEERQRLAQCDEGDTSADGEHDMPP